MPNVSQQIFKISAKEIGKLKTSFEKERARQSLKVDSAMVAAVDLVWITARSRRPNIGKKGNRVSDPNASFGVPVRTGALRASIQKEIKPEAGKITGRVYTNSPYAIFIEYGTSKMRMRPFMAPAFWINRERILKLFAS